jgi:predicted ATPase with chaperone activity
MISPIATAVLSASGQIESENLDKYIIMGELSLDGGLQPIKGALPIAVQARKDGFKGFILPKQNASEVAIVKAGTLAEAIHFRSLDREGWGVSGETKSLVLVVRSRKTTNNDT